jgi:hypothetical protein
VSALRELLAEYGIDIDGEDPPLTVSELSSRLRSVDADAETVARAVALYSMTPWTNVPLYWLNGRGALIDEQRLTALAEYRRTDGMYLVVMADPDTCAPEDRTLEQERALTHAGPTVAEIDWTGFDAAIVAAAEQVRP